MDAKMIYSCWWSMVELSPSFCFTPLSVFIAAVYSWLVVNWAPLRRYWPDCQSLTEQLGCPTRLQTIMACCRVWQGIDRVSFFENAILLELKYRSQGEPVKMRSPSIKSKDPLGQESRDFLDDFALIASGSGGPDNVSAACMEISERDDQILVLRVARNGGINDEMLCHLRGTIRRVIENITAGSSDLSL